MFLPSQALVYEFVVPTQSGILSEGVKVKTRWQKSSVPTGRFGKEKQEVNEKSPLRSKQSTGCGLGAQRTITTATCRFTFPKQFQDGALMCVLICPLLPLLQKLEDGWACLSQPHANLCAAVFPIWYSSLKCGGFCILNSCPQRLLSLQYFQVPYISPV